MALLSLFNLDLGSLMKYWKRGRIEKVYEKMYDVAENLAHHEMNKFDGKLKSQLGLIPGKIEGNQDFLDKFTKFQSRSLNYRERRVQHHIDQMKELLQIKAEVETGLVLKRNPKQFHEKLKLLKAQFGKEWFFVLTNKNTAGYAKYGPTYTRKSVLKVLDGYLESHTPKPKKKASEAEIPGVDAV